MTLFLLGLFLHSVRFFLLLLHKFGQFRHGAVRRFSTTDDWLTASFGSTSTQSGLSTVIRAEGRAYAVYADIITAVAGQGSLNPPFRIFRVDDRSYQ